MRALCLACLAVSVIACQAKTTSKSTPAGAATLDLAHSSVSADRTTATADGVDAVTITVKLVDTAGHPAHGAVTFNASGTSNTLSTTQASSDATGQVSSTLVSTKAEAKLVVVQVDIGGKLQPLSASPAVTFVAGPAVTSGSTLTAPAFARIGATVPVTATFVDGHGNPLSNQTATLTLGGAGNTPAGPLTATTDAAGTVSFSFSSTQAEPKPLDAAVGGLHLQGAVQVTHAWFAVDGDLIAHDVLVSVADVTTTPHTWFAGTELGVYRSTDEGASWQRLIAGAEGIEADALAVDTTTTPATVYMGVSATGQVFAMPSNGNAWQPSFATGLAKLHGLTADSGTIYAYGNLACTSCSREMVVTLTPGANSWSTLGHAFALTANAGVVQVLVDHSRGSPDIFCTSEPSGVYHYNAAEDAWDPIDTAHLTHAFALALDPTPGAVRLYAADDMNDDVFVVDPYAAVPAWTSTALVGASLRSVLADTTTSPVTLYASDSANNLYTYQAGGSWQGPHAVADPLAYIESMSIDTASSPPRLFANTGSGGIFAAPTTTLQFARVSNGINDFGVDDIKVDATTTPSTLYVATYSAIYESSDLGDHWLRYPNLEQLGPKTVAFDHATAPATLYLGASVGAARFNPATGHWDDISTGLPSNNVRQLVQVGGLFALTNTQQVSEYDAAGGHWNVITGAGVIAGRQVWAIAAFAGSLVASTDAGAFSYASGTWTALPAGCPSGAVTALNVDPGTGALLLLSPTVGFFSYNGSSCASLSSSPSLIGADVEAIAGLTLNAASTLFASRSGELLDILAPGAVDAVIAQDGLAAATYYVFAVDLASGSVFTGGDSHSGVFRTVTQGQ